MSKALLVCENTRETRKLRLQLGESNVTNRAMQAPTVKRNEVRITRLLLWIGERKELGVLVNAHRRFGHYGLQNTSRCNPNDWKINASNNFENDNVPLLPFLVEGRIRGLGVRRQLRVKPIRSLHTPTDAPCRKEFNFIETRRTYTFSSTNGRLPPRSTPISD